MTNIQFFAHFTPTHQHAEDTNSMHAPQHHLSRIPSVYKHFACGMVLYPLRACGQLWVGGGKGRGGLAPFLPLHLLPRHLPIDLIGCAAWAAELRHQCATAISFEICNHPCHDLYWRSTQACVLQLVRTGRAEVVLFALPCSVWSVACRTVTNLSEDRSHALFSQRVVRDRIWSNTLFSSEHPSTSKNWTFELWLLASPSVRTVCVRMLANGATRKKSR